MKAVTKKRGGRQRPKDAPTLAHLERAIRETGRRTGNLRLMRHFLWILRGVDKG